MKSPSYLNIFSKCRVGTSTLNVEIGKGDHPFGEPTSRLTPDSDFDMKQIYGTTLIFAPLLTGRAADVPKTVNTVLNQPSPLVRSTNIHFWILKPL